MTGASGQFKVRFPKTLFRYVRDLRGFEDRPLQQGGHRIFPRGMDNRHPRDHQCIATMNGVFKRVWIVTIYPIIVTLIREDKRITILVDTSEAARMLGMSKQSLERWRRNNIGPAFHKVGGAVGYDRDDLFSYLKAHRVGAGEDVAHRPSSRDLCSLSFAAKELNLDEDVLLEIIERNLAPDAARPTLVEEGGRQGYFYKRHALGELSYWMLMGGAECEMAAVKEIIRRHDHDHGYYELFGRQPPDLFNRAVVVASE